MMTLANYGMGSSKQKDPNSAKVLSKSLQIRNRAELLLKQCLKSHYKVNDDKRIEILNAIRDYYSRIPFNVVIWNKYQTKQCIIDSILLLDSKFDPYKAVDAFKVIEKMLVNLVYLPWHKEFRSIHTYSGSYKLSLSEPLIGVEEVLKAAGFQQSHDCPRHLVLPDDKMPQVDDGESVTSVIFDCMLAQSVCSNIIEVFENYCKPSKHSELKFSEINTRSWIQAYFTERSHQTTERACGSIQEILSNIANHIAKLDISTTKVSSLDGRANDRGGGTSQKTLSDVALRYPSRSRTQERTREFLAQQSHEVDNLLTLSDDLLRLPNSSEGNRKTTSTTRQNDSTSLLQRPNTRPIQGDSIQQQSMLNNGYNTHQYHRQALYDRMSSKTIDAIDSTGDYQNSETYRESNDSLNHHIDIDLAPNDREPLIPKTDRKTAMHQMTQPQYKRNALFENNLAKSNATCQLGSSRHNFDEFHYNESTSHPQLSSNHQLRSMNSYKYNNSPHRKYESRLTDNIYKERSYWSCGTCTYNNQMTSEICEMCQNRKLTR